ncbi:hypothetical protein L1280_002797 [Deinococcus sp. HSC-46F16]|uniref:hypothetical protein n=1 Tax=Deinococcus sp. HSC-46F16 TaxID=2910968 RepID=UPI00209F2B54|nr:hypothetical protein [Deinococcus sp. HSC-46F16]MCP2015629.1 hypothetical protein [Deinococcus sp. HSC-46F16]
MKKLLLALALLLTSQAAAARWEYAILVYGNNFAEWQSPSGYITTDDLKKTMAKMKCKLPKGSANFIDFLNCAGASGWELVQVDVENSQWIFKRSR